VLLAFVRLARYPDTNLDQGAAWPCFLPSQRRELIDRTGDRSTRTSDDVRAFIHEIVNHRIGRLKPPPVIVVSFVLQAVDDSRPIEPGGAIESILRIRQV